MHNPIECFHYSWQLAPKAMLFLSSSPYSETFEEWHVPVTGAPGHPQKGKKRRRRSRGAKSEMQQKWAFLAELASVDQSWLHFALFSAYQAQRCRTPSLTPPYSQTTHALQACTLSSKCCKPLVWLCADETLEETSLAFLYSLKLSRLCCMQVLCFVQVDV